MTTRIDLDRIDVLVPNFKRRLSGVTATIVRLVPLQAKQMALTAVAPHMPAHVPNVSPWSLLTMSRSGPSGPRVWHARRNTEMLAGLVLKHVLRKRLKLVFTSASQRKHSGYTKWLIKQMDQLVATSRKTAGYLEHPSEVILHGIDTVQFSPASDRSDFRDRLGVPNAVLVGCYGRIRAQKGTGDFLEAMIPVLKMRPEVHALIMGRATEKHHDYERCLRRRAKEEGLSDHIHFLPEVPVEQMADWYRILDVFVAPQRWEGFGLTPLEAMACGVPVVATDVGAFSELLADATSALVPPQDTEALQQGVLRFLDDDVYRAGVGRSARRRVEDQFDIRTEAEALMTVYRQLLAGH